MFQDWLSELRGVRYHHTVRYREYDDYIQSMTVAGDSLQIAAALATVFYMGSGVF